MGPGPCNSSTSSSISSSFARDSSVGPRAGGRGAKEKRHESRMRVALARADGVEGPPSVPCELSASLRALHDAQAEIDALRTENDLLRAGAVHDCTTEKYDQLLKSVLSSQSADEAARQAMTGGMLGELACVLHGGQRREYAGYPTLARGRPRHFRPSGSSEPARGQRPTGQQPLRSRCRAYHSCTCARTWPPWSRTSDR